jgi:hypothetical protein
MIDRKQKIGMVQFKVTFGVEATLKQIPLSTDIRSGCYLNKKTKPFLIQNFQISTGIRS